jgi:ribosomal protein L13
MNTGKRRFFSNHQPQGHDELMKKDCAVSRETTMYFKKVCKGMLPPCLHPRKRAQNKTTPDYSEKQTKMKSPSG